MLPPRSPKLDGNVERTVGTWRCEVHGCWEIPDDLDRINLPVDAFADEFNRAGRPPLPRLQNAPGVPEGRLVKRIGGHGLPRSRIEHGSATPMAVLENETDCRYQQREGSRIGERRVPETLNSDSVSHGARIDGRFLERRIG